MWPILQVLYYFHPKSHKVSHQFGTVNCVRCNFHPKSHKVSYPRYQLHRLSVWNSRLIVFGIQCDHHARLSHFVTDKLLLSRQLFFRSSWWCRVKDTIQWSWTRSRIRLFGCIRQDRLVQDSFNLLVWEKKEFIGPLPHSWKDQFYRSENVRLR